MVSLFAALAVSAAQPAAAPREAWPYARSACQLIAPTGEVILLDLTTRRAGAKLQGRVAASGAARWPAAGAVFRDAVSDHAAGAAFRVDEDSGVVLDLIPPHSGRDWGRAELFAERNGVRGLLLAHGYCSGAPQVPPRSAPIYTGTDAGFVEPASWPGPTCFVLARDGRYSRINYRFGRQDQQRIVAVEPLDDGIWTQARIVVPYQPAPLVSPRNNIQTYLASAGPLIGDGGPPRPGIIENAYRDLGTRALTIEMLFVPLRGRTEASDDAGFGICGWRDMPVENQE